MKLSEDKLDRVIGWALIVGIAGNLLLCLNLYRQVGNLEYKVNQLEADAYAAIESLSIDIHKLKYSKPTNKTGEFE